MGELSTAERVAEIAASVAKQRDVELVHTEVVGTKRDSVVRIYIDKPGGVTLDDCGGFSSDVEAVLDSEDFIPGRYVLEVSSPGIERQLYSLADFQRFVGRLVKVKTTAEIDGQKNFVGILTAVEGEEITIDDRTKGLATFRYSDVAKANLKIDLSKEFGRK
jgi:ribosome maturation factor RimP